MFQKILLSLSAAVFLMVSSPVFGDILVASGDPEYPPTAWLDGDKVIGVGAEVIDLLFDGLNVTVNSKYIGTWDRVMQEAKTGGIDAVFGVYKNEKRQEYLSYIDVPFMSDSNVVLIRKSAMSQIRNIADLTGRKGVYVKGYSYGDTFDHLLENMVAAPTVSDAFETLASAKADYMIFGANSADIDLKEQGYKDSIVKLKQNIFSRPLYIAISKESKYAEYIPMLEEKMKKMTTDGTIARVIKKYKNYYAQ